MVIVEIVADVNGTTLSPFWLAVPDAAGSRLLPSSAPSTFGAFSHGGNTRLMSGTRPPSYPRVASPPVNHLKLYHRGWHSQAVQILQHVPFLQSGHLQNQVHRFKKPSMHWNPSRRRMSPKVRAPPLSPVPTTLLHS